MKKAVILFSGGLDSTLLLAMALERGLLCHTLSFYYGQRHAIELEAAEAILNYYRAKQSLPILSTTIEIDRSPFSSSLLLNKKAILPENRSLEAIATQGIPPTYVPARNTLFLAYATAFAEHYSAEEIHIGCNYSDLTGYPDCRPSFISAYQSLLNCATKQAVEGAGPKLLTPLSAWDKPRIIQEAKLRNVPIELTWSCYNPIEQKPCGRCDACFLRKDV